MTYGEHPIKVVDDRTDRIGIRTLVLGKSWQPSKATFSIDSLDVEAPEAPQAPAGMEFIGRQTLPQPGGLRTLWTYTGVHGNGKDVTFKTRGNSPDYKFDPGFAEVSIALHPRIRALMETYGGYALDGEIVWPPTYEGGAQGGLGGNLPGHMQLGAVTGPAGGAANPMFGHGTFYRIEGTYSYRYALAAGQFASLPLPGSILSPGAIPGAAPPFGNRNYLFAGAPFQRHGPVLAVTELYWLSGPGGWPRQIYGASSQQ